MLGYDWPRLHALLNDLPIALLVTAVFFDLVALGTRRASIRQLGFWTMVIGVLGAVVTVLSGLQAEEHISHGEAVHRVMETHEQLGLITLGVFAVVALWRIVRESRMGGAERSMVTVLSIAGVGLIVATGLYGGRLVFDHAAGIPTRVLEAELYERTRPHEHAPGQAASQTDTSITPPLPGHVDPPGTPPHSHPPDAPPHKH
jgi:uncharacterized membrane protein